MDRVGAGTHPVGQIPGKAHCPRAEGQTIHESRPNGAPAPTLPADPRSATTRLTDGSLPIFTPPVDTPTKVSAAIHAASELLWINPNAAANQLRQAIEELLTHKGINRTFITSKHKRKRYTAHERIEKFRVANPANKEVA
ncbi:MAG: DUF4145 domain-containing protein, partial [Actinomycetia bacterium]|nr:DUF4145 domain-containing protein [Actinomycetes bacterium]